MNQLEELYGYRFSQEDARKKDAIWQVLCQAFFQKYVRETDTVIDIACGLGDFIRNIKATRRIGVDLNPDNRLRVDGGIEFIASSATQLTAIADATADVAFMSNFLEHLHSKDDVLQALREVRRILKPGGALLLLQPNIRYAYREYWDFFDHHTALSHLSAVEGLHLAGLRAEEVIARFLPFSTKSRLPQHPLLVRLYLGVPLVWPLLGKQFFIVARRPA